MDRKFNLKSLFERMYCFLCEKEKMSDIFFIMALLLTFSYKIEKVRDTVRFVLLILFPNDRIAYLIRNTYLLIQPLLYFIIYFVLIAFLYRIVYKYIRNRLERNNNRIKDKNHFEQSLYEYLEGDKLCGYLITGHWGTGKSMMLQDFFDHFYKYSNRNIYRISCFGIDSKQYLLDSIQATCEAADNSCKKRFIKLMSLIPVVGDFLYGILKDSYDLGSIKKGSIFIFEDFERITECYAPAKNVHTMIPPYNEKGDEKHILVELGNNIRDLINENQQIYKHKIEEKYNIISGLINELLETYKMRVVIVCNRDNLSGDIYENIFRWKLNCIQYTHDAKQIKSHDLITREFQNRFFNNQKDENIYTIHRFLMLISEDYDAVWDNSKEYHTDNLRVKQSIISGFIDTVYTFEKEILTSESIMVSIFYSIFLYEVWQENPSELESRPIGMNLGFLCLLTRHQEKYGLLQSKKIEKMQWAGFDLASYHEHHRSLVDVQEYISRMKTYSEMEYEYSILFQTYLTQEIMLPLRYFFIIYSYCDEIYTLDEAVKRISIKFEYEINVSTSDEEKKGYLIDELTNTYNMTSSFIYYEYDPTNRVNWVYMSLYEHYNAVLDVNQCNNDLMNCYYKWYRDRHDNTQTSALARKLMNRQKQDEPDEQ